MNRPAAPNWNKPLAALMDTILNGSIKFKHAAELDGALEVGENGRYRRPKWPKRLEMSAKQNFEENQFYCCVYEGN
ncbi:translocation protein sec62, putative [Eimeria maxima]|uniref:Translocation protein sec62, putative n=1 Tax=Eimeria maxima TaxID=5804 RepID=U6MBM7_EIMMA|nr:translocation protein sec62, putative [Eimeria maxima]CDJ60463.1 translocation protein sec62, putative [Eimeria maxima]